MDDYWAKNLPVNVGRFNFEREHFIYFQDSNAAWQAFTKGGFEDIRLENLSQRWATGYDFPAFKAGDVVKKVFPTTSPQPMQGFVLNTRRDKFKDRRVREALTWAFDFEDMNRTLFYGYYKRTTSYFEGTELASSGLPTGKELDILNTREGRGAARGVHQGVQAAGLRFAAVGARQSAPRLRAAAAGGLREPRAASWSTRRPASSSRSSSWATTRPTTASTSRSSTICGGSASTRICASSTRRNMSTGVRNFDYDITTVVLQQSESPGNEQRDFWSSQAAGTPGSRNYAGIRDPAVDKLINDVIYSTDRADLVAATHALDRVLLWNYYVVPQWYRPGLWLAYWNKFGIPDKQPSYVGADTDSWWIDPQKEAALEAKYGH